MLEFCRTKDLKKFFIKSKIQVYGKWIPAADAILSSHEDRIKYFLCL